MMPFLLCIIGCLFVTDAFILKQHEKGKNTLKPFEVTVSVKENSFEDDEFVIHSSTTENSRDISPFNSKTKSDDDVFIDDPFIVHPSSTKPSLIYHDSLHDISPNSWKKDNKAVTDAPSTTNDDDEDYEYDDDSDIGTDLTKHKNWPLVYHDESCGRSKLPLARKSIGGRNADMGAYPWMARLVYRSFRKDSERGSCGGTLISHHYVLTAAHCCFDDKVVELAYVVLGEYDIHHTKDCFRGNCAQKPVEVEVLLVKKHSLYGTKNFVSHDVCLIRLLHDVPFTDYIQPICLPSTVETDEKNLCNKTMTVAGWGTMENYPQTVRSRVLQELNVVVKPSEVCENIELDWESQICAAGMEHAQSPCPGDSGGPLMYYNTTGDSGRYMLMGIVSAGIPCSSDYPATDPAIFTRVTNVMPWILNNIL